MFLSDWGDGPAAEAIEAGQDDDKGYVRGERVQGFPARQAALGTLPRWGAGNQNRPPPALRGASVPARLSKSYEDARPARRTIVGRVPHRLPETYRRP
jgi:hypothetical protein